MPLKTFPDTVHAIVNSAAGGTLAVASAVSGKRCGIYRMLLVVGGPTVITVQDTSGAALSSPFSMTTNGTIVIDTPINGDPWFTSGAGLGLQLNSSAAVQVSADIYFLQGQ